MTRPEPVRIANLLREAPGMWVAIKDRHIVDVAPSPDRLHRSMKDRGIHGATVMRAPAEHEPLQVGLG